MVERAQLSVKKPEAKRENKVSQTQKKGPSQSISSQIDQILFLQRTIGNQAVGRLIKSGALQAKLRIGQPGDIYEQETDRVAEQVMRMPEPQVSNETKVSNPAENNSLQRKCPGCNKGIKIEKEEEEENLQKKEASGSTHEVTPELESSISAARSGGQPMPESVRAFFEPRFGHDFSGVRVHTDSKAAEAAQAVDARAYTVGRDVVFGTGQYDPGTREGRRLLVHELTHVIQQQTTGPRLARVPGDGEEAAIGSGVEALEVSNWKNTLERQGYRVFTRKEFDQVEWLNKAFPDKRARPDLVAINTSKKKILIGDITAGPWSQAKLKPGDIRKLPHDIGGEVETKPHLEKTVENARQAYRNLPDDMKDFQVTARDRWWKKGGYSREVTVAKGTSITKPPTAPPTVKPPAAPKATVPKTSPKTEVPEQIPKPVKPEPKPKETKIEKPTQAPARVERGIPQTGGPAPKRQQFQGARKVIYPQKGEPPPTIRGTCPPPKAAVIGEGLAIVIPAAMNAWQDLTIRDGVARRMLGKWSDIEKWRKENPKDVILCVVSLQEWIIPSDDMVGRGINYVEFYHGKDKESAEANWRRSLTTLVPKGWREVGPFFGWIEPTQPLDKLREEVAKKEACFIATACYNSPLAEEVRLLREFRDVVLRRTSPGRTFISIYYRISPPVAFFLQRHDPIRTVVRQTVLAPLVTVVRRSTKSWR